MFQKTGLFVYPLHLSDYSRIGGSALHQAWQLTNLARNDAWGRRVAISVPFARCVDPAGAAVADTVAGSLLGAAATAAAAAMAAALPVFSLVVTQRS